MEQADQAKSSGSASNRIDNSHPLSLIVGEHRVSPCSHETYVQFKLWVVRTLTEGEIDTYSKGDVSIAHWDDSAGEAYPHLLNPCECGAFLPIDVEPGPLLSSAIGLLSDLNKLRGRLTGMPLAYEALFDAMMEMAERSLETNTVLEIR